MPENIQDPFAGSKEVKPGKFTWGKVGDYIIGYFTSSKEIDTPNGRSKIYEIKGITGEYHFSEKKADENGNMVVNVDKETTQIEAGNYYGVWGGKVSDPKQLDEFFKKVKFGQKIGIQLKEKKPNKNPSYSPTNIFTTRMWDEQDPDFMGASAEDIAEASMM